MRLPKHRLLTIAAGLQTCGSRLSPWLLLFSLILSLAPLGTPVTKRFIRRHRLQKANPNAAVSDAVRPITYYLDPGAPEPTRSALLEGARWWNQAFEAAGFRNAFRVEMLPEGASPLDIRYNVINWVHRSTRGWSASSRCRAR